jgi:hypothetical protein
MKMSKAIIVIFMLVCSFLLEIPVYASEASDMMVPVVNESDETIGYLLFRESPNISIFSIGIITGAGVRIRQQPDTTSTVLGLLYKNDSVDINKKSGSWYNITTHRLPRVTGYVYATYIEL